LLSSKVFGHDVRTLVWYLMAGHRKLMQNQFRLGKGTGKRVNDMVFIMSSDYGGARAKLLGHVIQREFASGAWPSLLDEHDDQLVTLINPRVGNLCARPLESGISSPAIESPALCCFGPRGGRVGAHPSRAGEYGNQGSSPRDRELCRPWLISYMLHG
jgi:hypothetical protein